MRCMMWFLVGFSIWKAAGTFQAGTEMDSILSWEELPRKGTVFGRPRLLWCLCDHCVDGGSLNGAAVEDTFEFTLHNA